MGRDFKTNKQQEKKGNKKRQRLQFFLEESSEGSDAYKAVLGKQVGIDLSPNSDNK